MDVTEALVPLGFFAMIVGLVWMNLNFRSKKQADALATVRFAIEKGQSIDPTLIDALTPKRDPFAELKVGVVMIGVSLAFLVLAYFIGTIAEEARAPLLGTASFPFFIGLALVGLHLLLPKANRPKS